MSNPFRCSIFNPKLIIIFTFVMRFLLTLGINLEVRNKIGRTPLLSASFYRHNEVIEILIEEGANLSAQDNNRNSAVMWAMLGKHSDTLKILLSKGCDATLTDFRGRTPLERAQKISGLQASIAPNNLYLSEPWIHAIEILKNWQSEKK